MKKNIPKVKRKTSWVELFGEKGSDMSEDVRRERWEEWKKIAIEAGEQEMVDYWVKDNIEETCSGCIHREEDWCRSYGLPCNVNPILTLRSGIIGMACMGLGKEVEPPKQLELFESETPF